MSSLLIVRWQSKYLVVRTLHMLQSLQEMEMDCENDDFLHRYMYSLAMTFHNCFTCPVALKRLSLNQ